MEVLQGQIDAFDFLGDIKKEIVQEEKKVIRKKKSSKSFETFENIEGQITAFDLVESQEEEVKVEFTKEQLEVIEKLKREAEWVEYSLYSSGQVLFTEKRDIKSKVVPMGEENKKYYLKAQCLTSCISASGESVCWLGKDKWANPVKTIVKEEE